MRGSGEVWNGKATHSQTGGNGTRGEPGIPEEAATAGTTRYRSTWSIGPGHGAGIDSALPRGGISVTATPRARNLVAELKARSPFAPEAKTLTTISQYPNSLKWTVESLARGADRS